MKIWNLLVRLCVAGSIVHSLWDCDSLSGADIKDGIKTTITVAASTPEFTRKGEGDVIELQNGRLMLAYMEFSGTGSDEAKTRFVIQESADRGKTWSGHRLLAETAPGDMNVYSPNLIRSKDGGILLVFMRQHQTSPLTTTHHVWKSTDEGQTFVPWSVFGKGETYNVCNAVVKRLKSGRLLLPVTFTPKTGPSYGGVVLLSDDDGLTWREAENRVFLPMRGVMEPHVEQASDGRVLMVMRNQLGSLQMSESVDGEQTWTEPKSMGLKSPESCPELTRIPSTGDLLVIWNNSYDPKFTSHFGKRSPLTAAVSRNNGRTWQHLRDIETDPKRAFSNPGCRFMRDGTAILNYWTCEYLPNWAMQDVIDIRVAIIDTPWFYESTEPTDGLVLKTESFDREPSWLGVNNRIAQEREPVTIRQDFGFSARTSHAGGEMPGEIGGFVTPAGEAAFYGKEIAQVDFDQRLTASGTINVVSGGTNLLIGFFNSESVNDWRTPNTIAIRLNGRGETFFAYVEYCTSKWRAGGDTTPFPSVTDPKTGRWNLIGYPCDKPVKWTLTYDPKGNEGQGVVTATIGNDTASCKLDGTHKLDGATFNRFGILNVLKSADSGSEIWFDDIVIQGEQVETFSQDPKWAGRNNRSMSRTRLVRPWFDFGYSNSQFAGGEKSGELGGRIFRGDCREPSRMACYGDQVGPLSLERRLKADGRIALRRGVSDSTTLFGFYNSNASMQSNDSQSDGLPASVLGIHVEGPSSEGFKFYPVLRPASGSGIVGDVRASPTIYPDGKSHQWSLDYVPSNGDGRGRITITLDGKSTSLDLPDNARLDGTAFDRFGIITSWIDGNSQDVYWDDVTYTVRQE